MRHGSPGAAETIDVFGSVWRMGMGRRFDTEKGVGVRHEKDGVGALDRQAAEGARDERQQKQTFESRQRRVLPCRLLRHP